MKARRCQGCGANLPDTAAGEALRCPFCGLVHDASGNSRATPAAQVHISAGDVKRPLKWILAIVLILVAVSLVPVIGGLYVGWRAINTVTTTTDLASLASNLTKEVRLSPADLRTAPAGIHELDAALPPGGLSAMDAVGALPWALAIAQSWSSDARLERIDVTRMRPDGTVNAQDDPEAQVRYRFKSPSRLAELREQSRLTTSARVPVELFVTARSGTLRGQVIEATRVSERDLALPPHPSMQSLPKLVKMTAVEQVIADVPFLSGYAIHLPNEGWVWYFSTLANESKPRIRATDGAVWPYRTR